MGKATGFLEYARETPVRRPVVERVNDWFEIYQPMPEESVKTQAARCMDCGVPFCHTGCPVNNLIPDWNDLVYSGRWRDAIRQLHATNNFPEFTGRICPAPCESACVLGINEPAVAIKSVENAIVERAWQEGWVKPEKPDRRSGKRVAIIGSGPAGLAAAQQLNRVGHHVTVFEKADRIGGLLRYGIPDFKLEKSVVDRRLDQLKAEGIEFVLNAWIGRTHSAADMLRDYHAVMIAVGAEAPREVEIPGRHLEGVHWAMDYLTQQNKVVAGESVPDAERILATGKHVVILGGGDTGADCLGTAHRQKCKSVTMLQHNQRPPDERHPSTPWPEWPFQLRVEGAHEEGGTREFAVQTQAFLGDSGGNVRKLQCVRVGPKPKFEPVPGSEFTLDADLVLVAIGYRGAVKPGLLEQLGVETNARGVVVTDKNYQASVPKVFAAGDARVGATLVVTAIAEGRKCAHHIDKSLMGASKLPL
ncbi:MAG: glutamate synthase subunit beta [Bryobacteraceae bacterium]|nr:glutamate synthase subunit beta [Bryobacteraceae bacterium]